MGTRPSRSTVTPSGVHADTGRSAYIVPIVGKKFFRIWNDDYARQHRAGLANVRGHYDALKKDIVDGKLTPPATADELKAFKAPATK